MNKAGLKMFRHIILFQFKPSLSVSEIAAIFTAIGELQQIITGIIDYSWGKNQWFGQSKSLDYCFIMDFNTKDSRDRYQVHAAHVNVVNEWVIPNVLNAAVFDYYISS
jgi:hypothetical protein